VEASGNVQSFIPRCIDPGRMTNITEDGRYFSGYDHKIHDSDGHDFYVDDGLWDTYRSLHPCSYFSKRRNRRI